LRGSVGELNVFSMALNESTMAEHSVALLNKEVLEWVEKAPIEEEVASVTRLDNIYHKFNKTLGQLDGLTAADDLAKETRKIYHNLENILKYIDDTKTTDPHYSEISDLRTSVVDAMNDFSDYGVATSARTTSAYKYQQLQSYGDRLGSVGDMIDSDVVQGTVDRAPSLHIYRPSTMQEPYSQKLFAMKADRVVINEFVKSEILTHASSLLDNWQVSKPKSFSNDLSKAFVSMSYAGQTAQFGSSLFENHKISPLGIRKYSDHINIKI